VDQDVAPVARAGDILAGGCVAGDDAGIDLVHVDGVRPGSHQVLVRDDVLFMLTGLARRIVR